MYKLLIADDEPKIRKGLSELFPWEEFGFTDICFAANGQEALEKAKSIKPNLCLVDICMPLVSGLTFIEKLQSLAPETVCIVISGFDEFEYVQKSLQLGVFDYILKPVQEKCLHATVMRAIDRLISIERSKEQQNRVHELFKKNSQAIREQFLNDILYGVLSVEEIDDLLEIFDVKNPKTGYGLLIAQLPAQQMRTVVCIDQIEWPIKLLQFAMQNIVLELLAKLGYVFNCVDKFRNNLFLVVFDKSCDCDSICTNISGILKDILHISVELDFFQIDSLSQLSDIYAEWMDLTDSAVSPIVLSAQRYMETFFCNQQLSIQMVADQLNVSSSYLSSLFSIETGLTLIDYLTRVRVQKAINLLVTTNKKIVEISQMVGYNSQHYFCAVFKRLIGISPSEYRQNNLP